MRFVIAAAGIWISIAVFAELPSIGESPSFRQPSLSVSRTDPPLPRRLRFDHLDINDGLSQSSVHAVAQDPQGFMWFGTEDGLNRYDGQTFRIFRYDDQDTTSVSSNVIVALFVDKEGRLWVGTLEGLDRYDPNTEAFIRYGSREEGTHGVLIRNIEQTPDGILWASSDAGLLALDPQSGRMRRYVHDGSDSASLPGNRLFAVRPCSDAEIWIGTGNTGLALLRRDDTGERIERFDEPELRLTFDVRCASSGDLWLATTRGLFRGRPGSGRLQQVAREATSQDSSPYRIVEDGRGGVWVATLSSGLLHVDGSGGVSTFRANIRDPRFLRDDQLRSLYVDAAGTMWIGTMSRGVTRTNPLRQRFDHIQLGPGAEDGFSSSNVSAVVQDSSGTVWIGTYDGLFRGRSAAGPFEHVDARSGLPVAAVYALTIGRLGEIWVGTDAGLCRLPKGTRRFSCYRSLLGPRSLPNDYVTALTVDREGSLWVASRNGLGRFVPETDDFDVFLTDPGDSSSLSNNDVRAVMEDSAGTLWVGTIAGLNRFDAKKRTFTRYLHDPADEKSLNHSFVWALHEDSRGRIWIGTLGGLNLYDPPTDGFERFGVADGLPNEVIYGVLDDDRGRFWVSTNRGLSRFEIARRDDGRALVRVQNFSTDDGLQSEEFTVNARYRLSDGRFIFGGVNGFNIFHPDSVLLNDHVPPVEITGLTVMGRAWPEPAGALRTIRLPHDRNFFTFSFAALDFVSPQRNRYAYKLEGLDRDWTDAGSRPVAVYTSVPPGHYTFRARGSNGDGLWNEAGAAVQVVILPPFWQTWWFRLGALTLVASLLGLAYRLRVRRLLEVERMRLRIASDLHDDVGASLGSIILLSNMVQRQPSLDASNQRRLETIVRTARDMSADLRDIVWIVNPENDNLVNLIDRMQQVSSAMLDGIPHAFSAEEGVSAVSLDMSFRRNVLLIFKELLHNVRRHAEASRVEIQVAKDSGVLVLRVSDDGRGFAADVQGDGHGLKSIAARIAEMGGRLIIDSEPSRGTKVTGFIPFHANA